jgi:hypothetical protein
MPSDSNKPIQATIPLGVIEYVIHFKSPILESWKDLATLVRPVLVRLEPFGFKLEGVEAKQSEKLGDRVVIFRRANLPNFTFNVGLGRMWFYAEDLDWSDAEHTMKCMSAAIETVRDSFGVEFASQTMTLAMHVQFKDENPGKVTAPLLSSSALQLMDGEVRVHGIILLRQKATILIDASAGYANAIFVKIVREHSPGTPLAEIAEILRNDEIKLFDTLNIESAL